MNKHRQFEDPPFVQKLFGSTAFAWIWLPIRFYLGYIWLTSGWGKFNNPKWMDTGVALQEFWQKAIVVPETGRPPVAFDWYRNILEFLFSGGHHVWFAKLVVLGELAVGLGLIVGAFVGIAAFFGAFMNWNFLMGGTSISTNPVMLVLAIFLVLAWKTAGYYGVDRWLLVGLGTPWQPGEIFSHLKESQEGPLPPAARSTGPA